MKAQLLYKALFTLLLIPSLLLGDNGICEWEGKYTKEKTIKKEFAVNSDAILKVNNSYGNIDVITWSENRTVIEVTIITNGNDEEKVKQKLDEITVEFDASPSLVSAKTIFNKNKSSSWWKWNNSNKVNMKINYLIKIPISNEVDLNNDYGSINLDKLEGRAKINCDYGKITTKELMADNNSLNFDYTNNSFFEYIKSGKINADYSGFTVSKTKDLDINADYTSSEVEVAENITYNCDYGSIKVHKTNTLSGNGDYLTVRLGDVYKAVSIKSDYGSIKIDKLHKNFGGLSINSDYTGIKIGYDPNLSFNFEFDLQYSGLTGADGFEFTKKKVEHSSKYYSGHYGNSNTDSKLTIASDYGGVTFYKN